MTDSVSQKANQTTVKREFDDVELGEDKNDLRPPLKIIRLDSGRELIDFTDD